MRRRAADCQSKKGQASRLSGQERTGKQIIRAGKDRQAEVRLEKEQQIIRAENDRQAEVR